MAEEYKNREEQYHKNLPLWSHFNIFDKTIDGEIPSTRLTSWDDFHKVVSHYCSKDDGSEFIFRGQHKYSWFLDPTLSRITNGTIDQEIAEKQLKNFKLSIRGRISDNSILSSNMNNNGFDEELWAIGQHHGLATPLLDWTLSPYVALFFAFMNEDPHDWIDEKGKLNNNSRVIYILNKSFIEDLEEPLENRYPRIIEPSKDDHGRLVNQAGLFVMAPYGENLESSLFKALDESKIDINNVEEVAKYLCKIHVPNSPKYRADCLGHLRRMNIHHASLFPDVIGSSGYCNELAREFVLHRGKITETDAKETKAPIFKIDADFWRKHKLPVDDNTIRGFTDSLLKENIELQSLKSSELMNVANIVVNFINEKACVDWYKRESQLARIRTIIRRALTKMNFNEDLISQAAADIVKVAAELSENADNKNKMN